MFSACSAPGQSGSETDPSDSTVVDSPQIAQLPPVSLSERIGDSVLDVIQHPDKVFAIRFAADNGRTVLDSSVFWEFKVDSLIEIREGAILHTLAEKLTAPGNYAQGDLLPRCPFNPSIGFEFRKGTNPVLFIASIDGCNLAKFYHRETPVKTLQCSRLVDYFQEILTRFDE